MDIASEKAALRREMLERRRSMPAGEVQVRSLAVLRGLWASGLLLHRKTVAIYAAAGGEVVTAPLFHQLRDEGARVVLPRVRGRGPELDFYPVENWGALELSRFGIPEPKAEGPTAPPEEFDLVVVPGVAFDRSGGRVGYGMGCYDRVLARLRPEAPRVGIGYDYQLVPHTPQDEHDAPLSAVITESEIVSVP